MFNKIKIAIFVITVGLISGCSTTNSIPYKASTTNVISIQNTFKNNGTKVAVGSFSMGAGVEENLICRMMGPVTVAPGKNISQYVKDAFQEELFLAQVYSTSSTNVIEGRIEKLSFSSVSPANWEVALHVSSKHSPGYSVAVKYNYDTSFDAWSACKNVADAFAPAVQELLKQVVTHPQFASLSK